MVTNPVRGELVRAMHKQPRLELESNGRAFDGERRTEDELGEFLPTEMIDGRVYGSRNL